MGSVIWTENGAWVLIKRHIWCDVKATKLWPLNLMTTAAALVVKDWENQGWPWLCIGVITHKQTHAHMHARTHARTRTVTGYRGTCLWQCLNSWNCGHPSALGLILGPAPWWVIDTDDKPVWGSYRAANPCTTCHLLNWHSSNHRPEAKVNNPLPLTSKYCCCKWPFFPSHKAIIQKWHWCLV